MAKYIFRLDDIAENMNEKNYLKLKKIFLKYDIKPIIGVIPNNQDPMLLSFPKVSFNFWEEVYQRQNDNQWTIAQHGYTHEYETNSSGILKINNRSEFAGLSYEKQMIKIKKGLKILNEKNIKTNMFMAPAHSFDENTVEVLKAQGFKYLTDGYGLFPYKFNNITFIPQLFSKPRKMPYGIYTWCLHLNNMSDEDIKDIESFIKKNYKKIINVEESMMYESNTTVQMIINKVIGIILKQLRRIKNIK